jgi:hypothetical protein
VLVEVDNADGLIGEDCSAGAARAVSDSRRRELRWLHDIRSEAITDIRSPPGGLRQASAHPHGGYRQPMIECLRLPTVRATAAFIVSNEAAIDLRFSPASHMFAGKPTRFTSA